MAYPPEKALRISRRVAIPIITAATTAIIVPPMIENPSAASAQETAMRFNSNHLWFPKRKGLVNNGGNLYKPNGPLAFYDQIRNYQTNVQGHVENVFINEPNMPSWRGYCDAAANTNLRLAFLEAAGAISEAQANTIYDNEHLYGLMVALHAGDVAARVDLTQTAEAFKRNNEENLNKMITEQRPFVAQMLFGGVDEKWFFVVHGVKGNQVIVTGFGMTTTMPITNMIDSYHPIPYKEALKRTLPRELLYEQHANRYTEHKVGFEEEIVKSIVGISY